MPASGDEAGLEGYRVIDGSGRRLGTVTVVLRRDDDLFLVVESGSPFHREHRAVGLDRVAFVDHGRCTVGLSLSGTQLSRAPALSRKLAAPAGSADAVRVRVVPPAVPLSTRTVRAASRPSLPLAAFTGALGLLALLAVILFVTAPWDAWEFALFGLPALLLAAAFAVAYRSVATFRDPAGNVIGAWQQGSPGRTD